MPGPTPHRRIAQDVREAIKTGDYRPGQQLPSGNALAQRYGVSRQTAHKDVEGGYGDTIYTLHRDVVGVKIGQARMLDHLGIPKVSAKDIDDALDAE